MSIGHLDDETRQRNEEAFWAQGPDRILPEDKYEKRKGTLIPFTVDFAEGSIGKIDIYCNAGVVVFDIEGFKFVLPKFLVLAEVAKKGREQAAKDLQVSDHLVRDYIRRLRVLNPHLAAKDEALLIARANELGLFEENAINRLVELYQAFWPRQSTRR